MTCDTNFLFPQFVPNQILTDTQLNQLRNYLCGQERLTRAHLVGTGIACGLGWAVGENSTSITITAGLGISSEGFLIGLPKDVTYIKYRVYADPDNDGSGPPCNGVPQGQSLYPLWAKSAEIKADIYELLDEEAPALIAAENRGPERPMQPLTAAAFAGRVLVLYLEMEPRRLNSCLVTDCDNKGRNVNLVPRALLVKRANELFRAEPPEGSAAEKLFMHYARVPRLCTRLQLRMLTDQTALDRTYREIAEQAWTELTKHIVWARDTFGILLDISSLPDGLLREAGGRLFAGESGQYVYDAVKDLVTAYNEFLAAACPVLTACCRTRDFPRHLALGALDRTEDYRHEFVPSGAAPAGRGDLDRARRLLLRLRDMLRALRFRPLDHVLLLPSHTETHPLSERAIPSYFEVKEGHLLASWRSGCPCTLAPLWRPPAEEDRLDALKHDYNRATFIRIEGHVGQPRTNAVERILSARADANAEFDVIVARVRDDEVRQLHNELKRTGDEMDERRRALRLALWAGWADGQLTEQSSKEAERLIGNLVERNEASFGAAQQLARYAESWPPADRCSDVANEYQAPRRATICTLLKALGLIESALLARWYPAETARAAQIADGMTRAAVALAAEAIAERNTNPDDWVAEASRALDEFVNSSEAIRPVAAVIASLWLVQACIESLLRAALPPHLWSFDYAEFDRRHKNVEEAALTAWLLLGIPVGAVVTTAPAPKIHLPSTRRGPAVEVPTGSQRPSLTASERGDLMAALLELAHSCARTRFRAISDAWVDLSLLSNLADSVDGLEHLAGVEKGGTLVLLCNRVEQQTIVADFSLACGCLAAMEPTAVKPAIHCAIDYRIVTLEEESGKYKVASVDLPIAANDQDVGARDDHPNWKPKIVGNGRSDLGAHLAVHDLHGRFLVAYRNEAPIPGAIDRFRYDIEEGDRSDRGTVLLLLLPKFKASAEVYGTVTSGGKALVGASVTISGNDIPFKTGEGGFYQFRDLAPGSYTVSVSHPGYVAQSTSKLLRASDKENIDFNLSPTEARPGAIEVLVEDNNHRPLDGVDVLVGRVMDTGGTVPVGPSRKTQNGRASFPNLAAGEYWVGAFHARFAPEHKTANVVAGQSAEVKFVLTSVALVVPDDYVVAVVEAKSWPKPDAAKRVESVYLERAVLRREGIVKAVANDPEIVEVAVAAMDFLDDVMASSEYSDGEIARAYERITRRIQTSIASAPAEHTVPLQQVLSAVTLGMLDRLSLTNAKTLGTDARRALHIAADSVSAAGIQPATLVTQWKADELSGELGLQPLSDLGSVWR
jgi:hypothetical protein